METMTKNFIFQYETNIKIEEIALSDYETDIYRNYGKVCHFPLRGNN